MSTRKAKIKRGGSKPISIHLRFENAYTPEPNTGCWLWQRGYRAGYGGINFEGKKQSAHRVSFKLFNGPINNGLHVLHSCDMTSCVNPSHLRLGTHIENMQDREKRGRGNQPSGRRHARWVSDEIREQIKQMALTGAFKKDIASKFGVSANFVTRLTPEINGRDRYRAAEIRGAK